MPFETITVTVAGANPQTKTVSVFVDPNTGAGSGTVSFEGTNGGIDTATAKATIAGAALTSNVANLAWQATNGIVSLISSVSWTVFNNPTNGTVWQGGSSFGTQVAILSGQNTVIADQVVNNVPISGMISPDGNTGEFKIFPPRINSVTNTGTWLTDVTLTNQENYMTVLQGKVVVQQAGIQTFYFLVDDSWAAYFGPDTISGQAPSRVGGTFSTGSTSTPATPNLISGTFPNYPLFGTRNTQASEIQTTDYLYINFPKPGIYPFFFWWINFGHQAYFQCSYTAGQGAVPPPTGNGVSGGVIKPISLQTSPAATTPAGNLQLQLANGNLHITGTSLTSTTADAVTLNVIVQGIHYPTKVFIPLLEGATGKVPLYNDPTLSQFNFPTYNGHAVDKPSAAAAAFSLSGDNTEWQGRMSVTYDGANFELTYGGQAFDANIATTQLTISSEDIAWFNNTTKSYDVYAITAAGKGGNINIIELDYMIKPIASDLTLSPTTVSADGSNHVFTLNLRKPFSPQQQGSFNTGNNISLSVTLGGGATLTSPVAPIISSSGWLTGWTLNITIPASSTNISVSVNATLTGTLTYLNGTATFTTGTVNYISNQSVGTITCTGVALLPPVEYTFSFAPVASLTTSAINVTITAQVYNHTNVSNTVTFLRRANGTTTQSTLGTSSTPSSSTTGTVNGQTVFFKVYTLVVSSGLFPVGMNNVGFSCVDQNSLAMNPVFWSSTNFTQTQGGGGGGGGGGCPEVSMFVDRQMKVGDVREGFMLDTLQGEVETYVDGLPLCEPVEVMQLEFSNEICHRFRTENGAEIIVSESTPFPTKETIEQLAKGVAQEELPLLASAVHSGMHAITNVGNGPEWSLLTETECVGTRRVARLYCGGRNFAAGAVPGKFIYTHNIQIIK